VDSPRPGLFFVSSSSSSRVRRSIDSILISVLHVVCGRSARDPRTVREKIFPCGQSAAQSRTVRFFRVRLCQFGVLFRTVHVWCPDGPRPLHGRSAGPTRTVRPGFCSSELVLRFLFVCFRFLFLGFLVVPLRLFEPCLGSCLCMWVHGVVIGV
jgi:hypothetical protein